MLLSTVLSSASTVSAMTEPPRPPGDPYGANDPTSGSTPPPASPPPSPPPPGGYAPPPSGGYTPPPTGGYDPPPTGGYNAPPAGYNAPPAGYNAPPGGYNAPPPQYGGGSGIDDRSWNLINHFGGAAGAFLGGGVGGWIAPLIVMVTQGNRSPYLRSESVKALNFQILWTIVGVIGWATTCIGIGFIVIAAAWLMSVVFGVIAGVKASNNEPYNYPMTVQIIK